MVTLAQIAERAGVSVFTVSCALRGRGRVAAGTAERIRALATELGYVPSAAGRLLAEGRKRAVGQAGTCVIAVVAFGEAPRTGRALEMAQARERRMKTLATERGYRLELVRWGDFPTAKRLGEVLYARGVQGVILWTAGALAGMRPEALAGMPWEKFALVRISRGLEWLRCHTVRASAFSDTKYALERILAAGYRRIGVVLIPHSSSAEDDYGRLGALRAFEQLRRGDYEWLDVLQAEAAPDGRLPETVATWLRARRPEVVLGFPVSWRVWMEQSGWRVPEDVAFVGLPVQLAKEAQTGVATTGVLADFLSYDFPAALEMLHTELAAGRRGLPTQPVEHVLPQVWQEGVTMPGVK